jgi:hypothetical protein
VLLSVFRRKQKTNIFIFITLFLISNILPLSSCAAKKTPVAVEIIIAMTDASPDTAAGDLYLLPKARSFLELGQAEKRELRVRLASDELLSAAFSASFSNGENSEINQIKQGILDDGALYFSTSASPEQYAVLHCVNRTDTQRIALLLEGRLQTLRKQYRGTEWERMVESGQVVVIKKFVCLIVSPNAEAALNAAGKIIS